MLTGDDLTQIAFFAVLHEDVQGLVLDEGVKITDYVGVTERSKDVHLVLCLLLPPVAQLTNGNFLHDLDFLCSATSNFMYSAKAAFAQLLQYLKIPQGHHLYNVYGAGSTGRLLGPIPPDLRRSTFARNQAALACLGRVEAQSPLLIMGPSFSVSLLALTLVFSAEYDCIFEAPDGMMYDLSAMKRASPPDYTVSGSGDPYEYRCNVCHSTLQSCAGDFTGVATQWNSGGSCVAVLARQNPEFGGVNRPTMEYIDPDRPEEGVSLVYYNGDLCYMVVPYEREVRYNIHCDPTTRSELVSLSEPQTCKYVFDFNSKAGCPVDSQYSRAKKAAKKAFSPKKYLLWIGGVMMVYCILGVMYKRRVYGGEWSIPHKEFWADVPALVRDGIAFSVTKLRSIGSSQDI